MNTFPLVSVIVPVYKVEKYIDRCLSSICGQTYTHLEIICVDDGSPDNSIDILRAYAARDERVHIICRENGGLSAARNSGLEAAKGEWITFVDGDDWIERDTIESCISKISDRVDAVLYSICVDNEMGETDPDQANKEEYYRVKYEGETDFTDDVILSTDVSVCNKLFRASVIRENGLSFPVGRIYEDASFTGRFFLTARGGYFIPERSFYHYTQHVGSIMHMTRQGTPRAIEHLDILTDLYYVLARQHQEKARSNLLAHIADSYIDFAFRFSPPEYRKQVKRKAARIVKKIGVSNYTEFANIRLVSDVGINSLIRLFYRRRVSKVQYGLFGLMIFTTQRKNGFITHRVFGIKVHRKKIST
ncbi:MAG: glycosyltransferase family 2 protein [Akkermansia muciniphila]